jgi:hypothetical protein
MNYKQFENELEKLNIEDKEEINKFIEKIDINKDNFNDWVENLFENKHSELNLGKLPYVIDSLYQTEDRLLFMLCCMLIEATCEDIPFITPLENYRLFEAKFIELKHTLVDVYYHVDNGIANCMALIILNNDPELRYFNEEEKNILIEATIRKLNDIKNYIDNNKDIHESVYNDLEVIIDLSSYLKNQEISNLVVKLSSYKLNYSAHLFIIKYKLINEIEINNLDKMLENLDEIERLVSIYEKCNKIDLLPLDKITQESIAKSNMMRWLEYPTELGKMPESIELLDEFEVDGLSCYAYKFKDSTFKIKDYMIGVSGGYEKGKITARDTGWTFSNFELVNDDYIEQAKNMINQIKEYWESKTN